MVITVSASPTLDESKLELNGTAPGSLDSSFELATVGYESSGQLPLKLQSPLQAPCTSVLLQPYICGESYSMIKSNKTYLLTSSVRNSLC